MQTSTIAYTFSMLMLGALLPACSSSSDEPSGSSGSTATTGSSSSSSGNSIAGVTDCVDDDIMDGFTGPGYDPQKGLQPPVQASYVAATTVLLMSPDPAKQMLFMNLAGPVIAEVPMQSGFVGYQIAISGKCHYARTLTVWRDMASMMEFVASPNHAHAMANGNEVTTAAAVANWTIQAADMPPTWAVARMEIAGMGRPAY
jgi:hypothetical protein